MTVILYLLAFLSGAAALIYQVTWTNLLALTLGGTTLAMSAVVAGFMGGMGLGDWHRSLLDQAGCLDPRGPEAVKSRSDWILGGMKQ